MPKERPPHANSSFRMSAEEVAAIRLALRSHGIPVYPDRILAGPTKAATMKTSRRARSEAGRR